MQETFSQHQRERVMVLEPEAFFQYLDSLAVSEVPTTTETTIKGYRVKVNYDSITNEEMKRKRESVAKIIGDSIKKLKK